MTSFHKCWWISITSGAQYTESMCNIKFLFIYPPRLLSLGALPWEISQVHNDTCKLKTLGLLLHSLKHNKFGCTTKRVQLQLLQQMFKMFPFSFMQAISLFSHSSTTSSTILCGRPFHVSVKRCFRSITSRTGVWWTQSCLTPHIR